MAINYPGSIINSTQLSANSAVASGRWSMVEHMQNLKNNTWPVILVRESYFNLTSLLIHADGTNGANNNTFIDSSTNAFTVTRNGTQTQGTFSPFSVTGWSNYFDGSGDYLSAPLTFSNFTSGNFTIEGWFYFNDFSATRGICACTDLIEFYTTSTTMTFIYRNTPASPKWSTATATVSLSVNTWYHIAAVLNGTTITLYLNGISVGTVASVGTGAWGGGGTNNTIYIGADDAYTFGSIDYYQKGYISNFRFVASSVYTSSFTPSTTPLTSIASTLLLTCQSNRFVDNSSYALAVTPAGDACVVPFSPFAPTNQYSITNVGGSGYFGGNGNYAYTPTSANLDPGSSGAWTIEMYVYPVSSGHFYSHGNGAGYGNSLFLAWGLTSNAFRFGQGNGGGAGGANPVDYSTAGNYPANQWYHVAVAKDSSNNIRMFVNGALVNTVTNMTSSIASTPRAVINGLGDNNGTGNYGGSFYLSGIRWVKGSAVYTSAFTPPTTSPTAITNTAFLVNFTNSGIIDQTSKNNLITNGAAAISTTQSKFGGSSIALNGTSSYVNMPSSPLMDFGTGDFTIECWVYPTTNTVLYPTFLGNVTGWSAGASGHRYNNTGAASKFTFHLNGAGGDPFLTSTNTFSANQWIHYALTRSGNTFRMFVNGNLEASSSAYSGSYNLGLGGTNIGWSQWDGANGYFNGYVDEVRVTKSYARYTGSFTVPTIQFANA